MKNFIIIKQFFNYDILNLSYLDTGCVILTVKHNWCIYIFHKFQNTIFYILVNIAK